MKKTLLILALISAISISADAKWWIFGKSKADIGLRYLHINGVSADETGPRIKLFREMLGPDGLVKISGRASGGQIGAVRVTLDDKATWTEVKLAANGTFEHSFKPEPGKTYALLIEVTDTAGKMNKPEETRKELTLSEENVQAKVKEALDALFQAYNAEDLRKFMAGVGENFAADKGILERAVKRDFDALSAINLRYTLNNVAAGAQGRVFAAITYNRMVMVNKSGQTSTDTGSTEFVFDSKEGKLSLFSMKQPLMFGLSDAENVATGEVAGNTGTALVIDETGNLGGAETVTVDCRTDSCTGTMCAMPYTFSSENYFCASSGGGGDIWFYSIASNIGYSAPVQAKEFSKSLTSLTSAEVKNLSGYSAPGGSIPASTVNSYCFYLGADYYCVQPETIPSTGNEIAKFKVKQF